MPKVKISEFDTVAANNTDIDGINLGEGMLPSDVNNAMRELMAQLKDFQAGTAGDSFNGPIGSATPAAGTFTSLSDSGNLTFTGTGNRITGPMSGGTVASRLFFQSSITNGNSRIRVMPNGTSVVAGLELFNNSDPDNASFGSFDLTSTALTIGTSVVGTGTFLPITMSTGGSERLRIDTSGNVGIGTSSPDYRFTVVNAGATSGVIAGFGTNSVENLLTLSYDTALGESKFEGSAFGATCLSAPSTNAITFKTNSSERMRIASAGNIVAGFAVQEKQTAVAASDINLNLGNFFTRTISGTTTLTVSNIPTSGTTASFILDLTNGGSATVNWWSNVKWAGGTAPTLTSAGRDSLGFYTYDGGTTWTGLVLGKDIK